MAVPTPALYHHMHPQPPVLQGWTGEKAESAFAIGLCADILHAIYSFRTQSRDNFPYLRRRTNERKA